jgi:hypothetical protein
MLNNNACNHEEPFNPYTIQTPLKVPPGSSGFETLNLGKISEEEQV